MLPPGPWAYHYLKDVLGSVVGLARDYLPTGPARLAERYTYDPYGRPYVEKFTTTGGGGSQGYWSATNVCCNGSSTCGALTYSLFGNPFLFTGHRYDAASGTYHFKERTYIPPLGRWAQRDPIEYDAGSINLYEYVLSSPTYWIDPLGLEETGDDVDRLFKSGVGAKGAQNGLDQIKTEGAKALLGATGGEGHVPVVDPGAAQNAVLTGAEVVLIADTAVAGAKVVVIGVKALAKGGGYLLGKFAAKTGTKQCAKTGGEAIASGAQGLGKVAKSAAEKDLHRPYIRKSVRDEVEKQAKRNAEGRVLDPHTGRPTEGKPDLGHKPGKEYWREKEAAKREGLTQKEFNDRMNNPDLYQLEDAKSNRSHRYEKPK